MVPDNIKTIFATFLGGSFLFYTIYLYSVLPVTENLQTAKADAGKHLWQRLNCGACHQVYGLGGFLGPDLTNVYSQRGEEYIKAFIKGGNKTMPAFHLSDQEMESLLSYMRNLDASGSADPRTFSILNDGTIEQ
jgi:nitric oxide reductase subunit C